MTERPFLNRMSTGMLTGLVLPVLVFLVVFLFLRNEQNLPEYITRIVKRDVISSFISMCVFPNVFAFLLYNRFDKIYSARGVLGITIIWAIAVFMIKM